MQEQQKVAVLGAGAYGTALAKVLAGKGDPVSMYCRRPELVAQINEEGVNGKYLPTAKNGHFGNPQFPWERTEEAAAMRS